MTGVREAVRAGGFPAAPVIADVVCSTATKVIGPAGVGLIEGWAINSPQPANDPEAQ